MKPVERRDYVVLSIGASGLVGKTNLTVEEAFKLKNSLPSGTAVVALTSEVHGHYINQ